MQHTSHLVAGTTTSARTTHPVSVRTGQPHPAANQRSSCCTGAVVHPLHDITQQWQPTVEMSSIRVKGRAPPGLAARVLPAVRAAPLPELPI
jgi:hypothetical protein